MLCRHCDLAGRRGSSVSDIESGLKYRYLQYSITLSIRSYFVIRKTALSFKLGSGESI